MVRHHVCTCDCLTIYLLSPAVKVDTPANWDEASGLIYNPEHRSWKDKPYEAMFAYGAFVPSAMVFSAKAYGKKVHTHYVNVSKQHALLRYVCI